MNGSLDASDASEPQADDAAELGAEWTGQADELPTEAADEAPLEMIDVDGSDVDAEVPDPDVQDEPLELDPALDLRNDPDNTELTGRLDEFGLELRSVDDLDYSDNPILDWKTSGRREDLAWVVDEWDRSIAPGLATGATREDFAAHDQEQGADLDRQLANAYDTMLGDDAIHASPLPDGTLDVGGGRHRIELARERGISYLPVRVRR